MSRKTQTERRHTEGEEKKLHVLEPENPDDELKFIISKTNRANVKKTRVLCVRTRSLFAYSAKGGKTTLLHLSDVSTIERSTVDKKKVTLTFVNRPKMTINFADCALREKFLGRLVRLWRAATEEKSRVPFSMLDYNNVKVCTMTWNVGGSSPPGEDILELVLGEPALHDLYIINFQEASKKKEDWCLAFKSYCELSGVNFTVISTAKLWDMVQMVLAKESLCKFITHVESDHVACGVGDVLGNKGGIGTSFHIFDTPLCAINCHLAARAERLQQRQANYIRIVHTLQLGMKSCDILNQFDHVLWAGDLNYRVNGEFQQAVADVKEGKFDRLWVADQLAAEMQALRVLAGFKEGPLDFAPTYRWDRHTPEVSNKREQIPSWTDRVLWKSAHSSTLDFKTYKGFPEAYGSDHRPVVATFVLHPRLPYDGMEVMSTSSTVRDRKHLELGIAFPKVTLDVDVEDAEIQATLSSNILESSANPPAFSRTENGVWEGSPIKLLPYIFNKDEVKSSHITVTFSTATDDQEARDSRADIEKGRANVLGSAMVALDRTFVDNSGFNVMITKAGQVVGQFSGKFTAIQKGTIDFEMETAPALVVKTEKTGLFSMFGKSKAEPSEVELNCDTPASELAYVSFPFKSIMDKWLFHVEEYLTPSRDKGPAAALHGALCCLKELFLLGEGSWAKKLPIEVGLIKGTGDLGNASVAMGLACTYFRQKKDAQVVGFVNCGTGGTRLQLYAKVQGVISLMQEYKPTGGNKGVFSNLRVGMYLPNKENSADQIKEEAKVVMQSAPWLNPKLREKLAKLLKTKPEKLVIPIFGFVRGTIRNYWETCLSKDPHESALCESLVNSMMEAILGLGGASAGTILNEKTGYFLKQRLEGAMELVGCRALYAQYSAATNKQLEPVITLGVGRGSSQWTAIDPSAPDDYRKYGLEALQTGMDSPMFAEKLAAGIRDLYSTTEGLVKIVQSAVDRGHTPVIALKSGCLLNLSDGGSRGAGGKKRRKMLTEVVHAYYFNMMPVRVTLARWTGESVEHEICSSSVAAACAEAGGLLARPGESPRPQFVKVSLEGKDSFLTDLVDLPQDSVLVFATAQELIGNPFLLLSEAPHRFNKEEAKKGGGPSLKRPAQLNTSNHSPNSTPNSSAPTTPTASSGDANLSSATASVSARFRNFSRLNEMNNSAPPTPTAATAASTAASAAAAAAVNVSTPTAASSHTLVRSSISSSKEESISAIKRGSLRPADIISLPSSSALALAQALIEEDDEEGEDSASEQMFPKVSVNGADTEASVVDVEAEQAARLVRYRTLFASPGFDMSNIYAEALFDDEGSPEDGEIALIENEILQVKNQDSEWWFGVKLVDGTEGLFPHNFAKVLDLVAIKATLAPPSAPPKPPRTSSASVSTLNCVSAASSPPVPLPLASASSVEKRVPPPPAENKSTASDSSSKALSSPPVSPPSSPPVSPPLAHRTITSEPNTETEKPKTPLLAGECNLKVIATHSCDATAKATGGTYLSFVKGDKLTIVKQKSERWWWAINAKGNKGWVPANHVQAIE